MSSKENRPALFLLAGILLGGLILLVLSCADYLVHIPDRKAALHDQENLASAFCPDEAFDRFAILTLYPATVEDAWGSFSTDTILWYELGAQGTRLALPPGDYRIHVANETRYREYAVTLEAFTETALTLSTQDAPQCPDFLVLEAQAGAAERFDLAFALGCEAEIRVEQEGISLVKNSEAWSVLVEGTLKSGYYPFVVTLSNAGGTADVYMAVDIPYNSEENAIQTVEDLLSMRNNPGGSYYLTNDIDLSEMDAWAKLFTADAPFTGCLDGRGYEITGLTIPISEEMPHNSLLGYLQHARVQNLIIRGPTTNGQAASRAYPSAAALANSVVGSRIENCAVLGGLLDAGGACSGILGGVENSHLIGLFNSADVLTSLHTILPGTGGIFGGGGQSYIAYCANEGTVQGHHLTGGIAPHATGSAFRYCLNAGQIRGIELAGTYAPGGIVQSSAGGSKADCLFLRGQSPVGAGGGGPVFRIGAITWLELRDEAALSVLGSFSGEAAQWGFASKDAMGPIPLGIFSQTCEVPSLLTHEDGSLSIPPREGTSYFYTLDGSDPRIYGTEALSLDLPQNKRPQLAVYAASPGFYDSEIIYYDGR